MVVTSFLFLAFIAVVSFVLGMYISDATGGGHKEVFSLHRSVFASMAIVITLVTIVFVVLYIFTEHAVVLYVTLSLVFTAECCYFALKYHVLERSVRLIVSFGLAVAIVAYAYWWPSWISHDLLAVVMAGTLLGTVGVRRLTTIIVVLAAFTVYDIVMVYGTGLMQDLAYKMLSAEDGTGFIPPIVVIVPEHWLHFSGALKDNLKSILGVGDIVLPGFVVLYARKYQVVGWVIGAYVLGLALCTLIALTGHPVPALMVLVPMTLGGLLYATRGRWHALAWR